LFTVKRLKNTRTAGREIFWKKIIKIFSEFVTVNAICLFTCTALLFQAHDNKCCNNITLTANAFLHPVLIKQLTTTAEITPVG